VLRWGDVPYKIRPNRYKSDYRAQNQRPLCKAQRKPQPEDDRPNDQAIREAVFREETRDEGEEYRPRNPAGLSFSDLCRVPYHAGEGGRCGQSRENIWNLKSPIEILDLKRTKYAINEEASDGDQSGSPKFTELSAYPSDKQRKNQLNKIYFDQEIGISPLKELKIGKEGEAS